MAETHSFDPTLLDPELLAEIQLTTDLVIAVQTFDRPLRQEEVDRLLKLRVDDGGR